MSGLSEADYRVILGSLYPGLEADLVNRLVDFNTALNREVVSQRLWGQAGAPWEFNLRDLLRCENQRSKFFILHSVSVPLTNGSGSCSPKNFRIRTLLKMIFCVDIKPYTVEY